VTKWLIANNDGQRQRDFQVLDMGGQGWGAAGPCHRVRSVFSAPQIGLGNAPGFSLHRPHGGRTTQRRDGASPALRHFDVQVGEGGNFSAPSIGRANPASVTT